MLSNASSVGSNLLQALTASWLLCYASCRGHRQRKVMHNMQADAAGALPADAPVAAYLDQLPQPVSSVALGEALAMEAKAVHEVTR